jgi:biopolymer transport protein ExbD
MRLPDTRSHAQQYDNVMTPMIDVIFQLMIFFVCTASFQAAEAVLPTKFALPGTAGAAAAVELPDDLDELVVEILWSDNRVSYRINQRDYARLEEVRGVLAAMAQIKSDVPVILDVDGDVPLERVIDVYDACRQLGLVRVQFAASPEA